ncbi:hypothetical protein PICMEDRAFT_36991 [Pichia membranifaciens NRRL Y-2026]|uniref:phosphoinositide 5-phosphatase n=1 Tax=Pichia membranifaciens NRRL Y-2026 TaxID=763406 RepID=A0A1E3NF94_9ASCO|nr:hypothetical protein PICMEDRAFT_36991 [Pichia membranifaciens NRRL Y-2026]ODQ44825.1 hypothetical protein PICMEDRAFT_36991 [Pichia membranifaciens NRRL Y-2026]
MELYINDSTHTLAICSNNYALILVDSLQNRGVYAGSSNYLYNHSHSNHAVSPDGTTPKCLIEFVPRNTVPLHTFRRSPIELYGLLGLICLKGTMYVGFISGRANVGPLIPQVNVHQLVSTIFVSFSGEVYSLYNQYSHGSHSQQPLQQLQQLEEITSIMKLLETGTFYYSYDTDLAVKSQDWDIANKSDYTYTTVQSLQDDYAGRFVWNSNLISEVSIFRGRLADEERKIFDQGKFYITLIRGYVHREPFDVRDDSWITIISRQDCRKVGPLFGPACVDDEGNVANFVETELVVYTGDNLVSFTIVKGNVPLFWKLDTHLLSTKIEFPRSEDASKHAFNRFFETLCTEYNMVYVLDALSSKGSQPELSDRYANAIQELQTDYKELSVGYKKLTYGVSLGNRLKGKNDYMSLLLQDEQIHAALQNYSANQFNFKEWKQSSRQLGVFLVNTLDSNDRANHVQCKISEMILEHLFGTNFTPEVWSKHNLLWVMNGTALGKLSDTYNASIKTKNKTGGLIGKFAEQGKKYAEQSKKYVSGGPNNINGSSSGRQTQFDRLLGRKNKEFQVELIDPIHDYVLEGLNKRRNEFTTIKDLLIYTVTFNVNAVLYDGDLNDLLFPEEESYSKYDIITIALEEVIELTPSKVMSIDLSTRNFWERRFKEVLNKKHAKEYTLLRGEQLGGILLLVYASIEIIDNIKKVESSVKKTGFKGISANKGGVGITFTFSTHSRLCFVASHLAAGQSNSEERHQNYNTIATGLTFKRCKNIKDSDILIWMGDLNYRISLPNETVRKILQFRTPAFALKQLFEYDQLNAQMANGQTFPFFDEMEISFKPTYKFDKGTDYYDTSEKQRVPSWTDRILTHTKDKNVTSLEQVRYNSIPKYKFSDHKPVYGIFVAKLEIVNDSSKSVIEKQLYDITKQKLYASETGGVLLPGILSSLMSESRSKNLVKRGLPPPSSKDSRWWISKNKDGNMSDEKIGKVKVRFPELDSGEKMINPNLPKNPFTKTTEPLFVVREGL